MEQIIYIEQNDRDEATKLSKSFTLKETSDRAYINALGAEIAMKYLAQANINVSNAYNLHNINKIREEFDIADIMLPNIHLDIRMVYNEEEIFIPKSHFEYNLLPDIYLVFEVAKDSTHVKFLGFFEPKLINKNNKNKDYYFIEKEKLSNPDDLKTYIENHNGNTTQAIDEDEIELGQKLALSLIDNDINKDNKKELIDMLKKSSVLRQELIEFDNFELISYHTSQLEDFQNPDLEMPTPTLQNVDEFDMFETPFEATETVNQTELPTIETSSIEEIEEVITEEPILETLEQVEPLEILEEPVLESVETLEPIGELEPIEEILEEPVLESVETLEPDGELEPIEENLEEPVLESVETLESIGELEPIEENLEEPVLENVETLEPIGELEPIEEILEEPVLESDETLEPINSIEPIEDNIETAEETTLEAVEPIVNFEPIEEVVETPIEDSAFETTEELETLEVIEPTTSIEEFEPIAEINSTEEIITEEYSTEVTPIETLDTLEVLESLEPINETNNTEEVELELETPSTNIIQDLINEEKEINADIEYSEETFDPLDTLFNSGEEEKPANVAKTTPTPPPMPPTPPQPAAPTQKAVEQVKTNQSFENSKIISNQNITVGEIPIDINNTNKTNNNAPKIEQELGKIANDKPQANKKLLTAIVLLAIIGSGLSFTLLNKKPAKKVANKTQNKIAKEIPQLPPKESLEDVTTLTPVEPVKPAEKPIKKQTQKATKADAKAEVVKPAAPKGPAIETPYLEVKKLSWSIPDYLSYNDTFKNYLQTAGKSLKLALSSDLLLATEYSYSNKLQVDITLTKEGSIKDVTMLQSSGSTQIDDIVLRTVKESLTVLKAPNDAIVGDNLLLTLIIYL